MRMMADEKMPSDKEVACCQDALGWTEGFGEMEVMPKTRDAK